MNVRSKMLRQSVGINILLPLNYEGQYKTLWLLHGYTCDETEWMRFTAIERYAEKLGIAVVMPNAGRSWYTDTRYGSKYFSFISEELPSILRAHFKGMSDKREDNIIAGQSMGGYGAMKFALSLPEQYGACIALSGSLDITRKNRSCNIDLWRSIFGFEMEAPDELEGSEHDLFALASRLAEKNELIPNIYMWCGTEDALLNVNNKFHDLLNSLGITHTYETSEGDHSWRWWDLHIQSGLEKILEQKIYPTK